MSIFLSNATFDPALLNVSGAKLNHSGGTAINLTYGADKKPIVLRTPFMLSFGINTWGQQQQQQHSVTLSFYGHESEDPFFQVLCAMDKWLLEIASQHTWEWLKSKTALPLDRLQEQHFRTLKTSSGGGGVPNIKLKLKPTAHNSFSTLFFTTTTSTTTTTMHQLTATEDIAAQFVKGTLAAGLLQCAGIWVKDGRFGFSWKLLQLVLSPNPRRAAAAAAAAATAADSFTCMIED